jgi:hypothetical protein
MDGNSQRERRAPLLRRLVEKARFSTRWTSPIGGGGQMAKSVTTTTFRGHTLYPRISRAVETLLRKDKIVRPADVLVEMQLLKRKHLEDWRCGRVPYLERVINCNLSRLYAMDYVKTPDDFIDLAHFNRLVYHRSFGK